MDRLITKSFKRLLDKGIHRGFVTYEELAKSLGWDDMEENDLLIEGPIPHYEWRILDYEDQDKAIALGYDEKSWGSCK